jgi:peptidylprolyl isomerase
MRITGTLTVVVAAALSLAACSSSDEPSPSTSSAQATAPAAPAPASSAHKVGKECTADDVEVTGDFGKKPQITIPDTCDAPTKLVTKDLQPGTGPAAKAGDTLQMNYELVTWSDKQQKDSSFDAGQPFSLTLGKGEVIPGWDQGLVGIKQGARRLLIVPPDLGYGAQGAGGGQIKPNETLVFVADAVKVTPAG